LVFVGWKNPRTLERPPIHFPEPLGTNFRIADKPPSDGSIPGLVSDIAIYRQLSVKTMNAEPSGRVPVFVFRQKNDAA